MNLPERHSSLHTVTFVCISELQIPFRSAYTGALWARLFTTFQYGRRLGQLCAVRRNLAQGFGGASGLGDFTHFVIDRNEGEMRPQVTGRKIRRSSKMPHSLMSTTTGIEKRAVVEVATSVERAIFERPEKLTLCRGVSFRARQPDRLVARGVERRPLTWRRHRTKALTVNHAVNHALLRCAREEQAWAEGRRWLGVAPLTLL